jgi:hypothetical protein
LFDFLDSRILQMLPLWPPVPADDFSRAHEALRSRSGGFAKQEYSVVNDQFAGAPHQRRPRPGNRESAPHTTVGSHSLIPLNELQNCRPENTPCFSLTQAEKHASY